MPSTNPHARITAALPIRLEPRTVEWSELNAQNRAEGRVGARTFLTASAACSDIDVTAGGSAGRTVRLTWVDHPDERVPLTALKRGCLGMADTRRLAVRAIREAQADGQVWTPLLDACDDAGWPGCSGELRRAAAALADGLRPWLESPASCSAQLVRVLLCFRGPSIARLVAAASAALDDETLRTLAMRVPAKLLVRAPGLTAHGRGVLTEWAAAMVAAWLVSPFLSSGEWAQAALEMLAALDAHGHVVPLQVAAQLDGVRSRVLWSGAEADRSRALLTGVVTRALHEATAEDARAFGRPALYRFLSSDAAEIRLAAQIAAGRARRTA